MSAWPLDIHLAPVYLKWANESFTHGHDSDGMCYFQAAERAQKSLAHKVYKQMWNIKKCPQGDPEYGRKCFHNMAPLTSLPHQKCQAIEGVLGEIVSGDNEGRIAANELRMRANLVHRHLWMIHGRPNGDAEYGRHAFYGEQGKSSTIEQRLLATRLYADESRALTWLAGDKEIRLIKRADGGLEFVIIDDLTGDVNCTPVDMRNRGLDDAISRWSSYAVTADNARVVPSALRRCDELLEPVVDTLQLYWQGQELVWRIYHTASKTLSFIPADRRAKSLRARVFLAEDRAAFLRDYNFRFQLNTRHKLLSVSIDKKTFSSQLALNVSVDRDIWAVTLISGGPSSRSRHLSSLMARFGHAMIAYEGVESGSPFFKCIHLTTAPEQPLHRVRSDHEAEIEFRDHYHRRDCLRTPTWQRTREQIESMIEWCHHQNRRPVPFNHGGQLWTNSSLWSAMISLVQIASQVAATRREGGVAIGPRLHVETQYNCLTFSISALERANIHLPSPRGFIAEPNAYIESIVNNPATARLE